MSNRNYNKLFVHTNREEGSEKIVLGYQNDNKELVFAKDVETVFHIPPFTESLEISKCGLIESGATPGSFPAAADRIFKNLKGFGNVTSNGTPSEIAYGGWYCSWLYKDSAGRISWMDRYYNPGKLNLSTASRDLTSGPAYLNHNPVFYDVPSTMLLEAGVEYKYFHMGEKGYKELIDTFAGINKQHLMFHLQNWGTSAVDVAQYNLNPKIYTKNSFNNLFLTTQNFEDISFDSVIVLDTNNLTEVYLDYDEKYNKTNEFSLCFWSSCKNWANLNSTQLVGNFTNRGGYGIFIENINSYPFFIIPERKHGHLLLVNERLRPFQDKKISNDTSSPVTIQEIAITRDNEIVALCVPLSGTSGNSFLIKYDHTGATINKTFLTNSSIGSLQAFHQLLYGPNETFVVIGTYETRTYDSNLDLIKIVPNAETEVKYYGAYSYNVETDTSSLVLLKDVICSKFIGNINISLSSTDFNLYKNGNLFVSFFSNEKASAFNIDPLNRIWVTHGLNLVSVYDLEGNLIYKFTLNENYTFAEKIITFMSFYDPTTKTFEWKALIYGAGTFTLESSPKIHIYNMNGIPTDSINLFSSFSSYYLNLYDEDLYEFDFFVSGDITGYEHKRVFNNLSPYKNNSQIVLKANLKNRTKTDYEFETVKQYYPLNKWNPLDWQHIILTYKNRQFTLLANEKELIKFTHVPKLYFSYENQPTFYIGCQPGRIDSFNYEIKTSYRMFEGMLADIRLYDYCLTNEQIQLFAKASIKSEPLFWQYPTPKSQYLEKIERMFKNKKPGSKSSFFKIKLKGSNIFDEQTKRDFEEKIKQIIEDVKPIHTTLYKIEWID